MHAIKPIIKRKKIQWSILAFGMNAIGMPFNELMYALE
jgi:hypothetical protein